MRILLLILAVLLPSLAQSPPGPSEALDPAVQAVLKSVKEKFEDQRQDLQVRLKAKRLELATLLKQDNVEKPAVKAKLDEILVLEGERQTLFLNQIFEAKGQLTPVQWASYRRAIFRSLMRH